MCTTLQMYVYIEGEAWQLFSMWKFPTNSGTYPKWLPSGTWTRLLYLAPWLCSVHHYLCSKTLHPHWNNYICRPPKFKSYRTLPSTIPPSILVTPLKPDLVLLHNDDNHWADLLNKHKVKLSCSMLQKAEQRGLWDFILRHGMCRSSEAQWWKSGVRAFCGSRDITVFLNIFH